MNRTKQAIEKGLSLFQSILAEIPAIGEEFELSRSDFHAPRPGEDEEEAALARRRHFEWYLLERDSKHLEGVPVNACMEAWLESATPEVLDIAEALLHSFAGVFQVSAADPGQGIWLSDLFGLGEYPVEAGDNAKEIRPGDLIVGRIFPIGDGLYSMSQASSFFREPNLLKAVRRDLSSLRESRRGVMRIGQLEIERLFFEISVRPVGGTSDAVDLGQERTLAKLSLLKAGLDAGAVKDVMIEIAKASIAEDAGAVTRILNAMAFEDEVDMGRAHRTLTRLWTAETSPLVESTEPRAKISAKEGAKKVENVRAALARFDEQKAAGVDLEHLYEQLSEELGIKEPDTEEELITLPDFPGVVGAVVEEFLWDIERTQGAPVASSLERIRLLAEFGKHIGIFEELGKAQVLDFAGRWLLDHADLRDPEDARACMHSLTQFCIWSQEQHSHPLMDECAEFLEPLAKSIPRLVVLRQGAAERTSAHKPFDVHESSEGNLLLADDERRQHDARVEPKLGELIRQGDLLHGCITEGIFTFSACYPAELRKLLDFRS